MKYKIVFTNDGSHSIVNSEIDEYYHSKHGAIVEAEHVFIKNGFSSLDVSEMNILEIGFGSGLNALLTAYKALQKEITVNYHAIEKNPIEKAHYTKLNFTDLIGLDRKKLLDLHECSWKETNKINPYFQLTKHHISLEKYNSNKKFNIIYFDAFSPNKQPELWHQDIFQKMYNLLKDHGFLVTYCAKGSVKRTMQRAGFNVITLDGPPGKRQMTKGEKVQLKNCL